MPDHKQGAESLLPCPFCGAADGRLVQAFTRATDDFAFWSVECLDCGCEIADDESQAKADAAWNTRATSEASLSVERIREALERLAEPYFWTADGFSADASTPAHKAQDLHRRLWLARAALNTTAEGGER